MHLFMAQFLPSNLCTVCSLQQLQAVCSMGVYTAVHEWALIFLLLVDSASKHRVALDEQSGEVRKLNDLLKQRDTEIRAIREADAQRTTALQSAIQNYVTQTLP